MRPFSSRKKKSPSAETMNSAVTRPLDVALAEHAVVAEGRLRLAPGRIERVGEPGRVAHDAHAAPAAAGGGLGHQREPDVVRLAGGHDGDAGLVRDPLRLELVA